jgi:hypothetical protein
MKEEAQRSKKRRLQGVELKCCKPPEWHEGIAR